MKISIEKMNDTELMTRAAWLYFVGGLNQENTAQKLGITRARVNKLLQQSKEHGLVSIAINSRNIGLLPVEEKIRETFGLDFCRATPDFGISHNPNSNHEVYTKFAFESVAVEAANFLKAELAENPKLATGAGWGRTIGGLAKNLAGVTARDATFVSLSGSLTATSSFNSFEVVHSLASAVEADCYFLPVPFIANSLNDKRILFNQYSVQGALDRARNADLCFISCGELSETALLRRLNMISKEDAQSLRDAGAIGDTIGIFYDKYAQPVDHPINERALTVGMDVLRSRRTVAAVAGIEKLESLHALLRGGVLNGLILDGDLALALLKQLDDG